MRADLAVFPPTSCTLCPRCCHVNRAVGERGICGAADTLRVARAALHAWEEPVISVGAGSGTVFFSGCPLQCCYCQNAAISLDYEGVDISLERLVRIFLELQNDKKAANINLVTATHYLPWILAAVKQARNRGLFVPVVYNSSSYETVESIRALGGTVDVYLADFKYDSCKRSDAARLYSHASDYHDIAIRAIDAMLEQVGKPQFTHMKSLNAKSSKPDCAYVVSDCADADAGDVADGNVNGPDAGRGGLDGRHANGANEAVQGLAGNTGLEQSGDGSLMMARGVIVRHLLLPGRLEESKCVVAELWRRYGDSVLYSFMSQYTPPAKRLRFSELNRTVDSDEYEKLLDFADSIGMEDYFWQEGDAARESFIPAWDGKGVIPPDSF